MTVLFISKQTWLLAWMKSSLAKSDKALLVNYFIPMMPRQFPEIYQLHSPLNISRVSFCPNFRTCCCFLPQASTPWILLQMGLCRSSQDWGSEIYNSRIISQRGWKASLSWCFEHHLEVSWNGGTPKSSILIGFSTINNPFWGTPIYGNPHFTMLKWPLSRKNNFMFDQFWTYPYHPISFFNLERPQTFTFDLRYIHAVILLP